MTRPSSFLTAAFVAAASLRFAAAASPWLYVAAHVVA